MLGLLFQIDVLVTGKDAKAAAEAAAKIDGVTRVIYADGDNYRAGIAEDLAALILKTHESNSKALFKCLLKLAL